MPVVLKQSISPNHLLRIIRCKQLPERGGAKISEKRQRTGLRIRTLLS